ncbi:alpha-1-2-mannosidase-like protein [Apiospora arundinis]|uniref:Alpha-1-2-mannosidase-like protein n=1 Tax=Apiospora arundinis TaxID=335852 RepID=A0ABR2I1B7_9PEZI
MAPFLTSGIPRRRRVFVIAIFAFFIWALLPIESFNPPRRMLNSVMMMGGLELGASPLSSHTGAMLRYVDPLIGTVNGGHVFPGATLPYGMAKAVADVDNWGEIAAGFVSDTSKVTGFSHLHDSGTGGSPSLGNFPIFVHPGCPNDDYLNCDYSGATRAKDRITNTTVARPGYFSIALNNSVGYEMTATMHTTLFRINVPDQGDIAVSNDTTVPNSPLLLLDLTDLAKTRRGGEIQVDPATGRMTGSGKFSPSFGHGQYSAYFCADVSGAAVRKTGTFVKEKADETVKALGKGASEPAVPAGSAGGFVQLHRPRGSQFLARIGLSFKSVAQACQNGEKEIPNFDFDSVVKASEKAWSEKLSVIQVDEFGVNEGFLTTFWSGFYRALLSPQDYTGENPLWNSSEPYFDSFYCIWDSFRAQHPLLTLVDPKEQTRMVRALIDIYKHEGKLPDCRMSFAQGYTQGGSNGDVVLADAYIKKLHDGIDWNLGYEAVVSDAEIEPADWTSVGRGNLEAWKMYGFIPNDDVDTNHTGPQTRTVSRTVEYAYEDFTIALMARGLGKKDDERKYLERSKNWENVFDPDAEDQYTEGGRGVIGSDFKGFMQPRSRNGAFTYQNMRLCSPVYEMHKCYFDTVYDTYEGSPWLYTFYVPQDMASLIVRLGGKEAFIDRLNYFHSSGIIYMGNEQSFLPTYQFHYGGRPALSSYWLHQYIPSQFNSSINGIPGNDDCAMGAFTTFAFMGFFPVAGQDVYLLTPPLFREVSLQTPTGKRATIRNIGFDQSYEAIYIQKATLNGKPYTKNWITHDFFYHGGLLELTLGRNESDWGTREEDLPPSTSTQAGAP